MKQKFGGKLSYFISILSHTVAMTNFLHHPQKRDLVTELENAKNIIAKIKQFPYLSQSMLYEHLTVLKTVRRNLLVERAMPDGCSGKAIALRWDYHIVFY